MGRHQKELFKYRQKVLGVLNSKSKNKKKCKNEIGALQTYLAQCGYLRCSCSPGKYDNSTRQALERFRLCYGLRSNGTLKGKNPKILSLLNRHRCGVADSAAQAVAKSPDSPFLPVTYASIWSKSTLFYRLENYTQDFPPEEQQAIVRKAFDKWADPSGLEFVPVKGKEEVDISLAFYRGNHGDGVAFDGPKTPTGNMIAHAFSPAPLGGEFSGSIHFDKDELWKGQYKGEGISFFAVVFHEIGHVLGLGHSLNPVSVMYPYYNEDIKELGDEDVELIKYLYGLREQMKLLPQTEIQAIGVQLGIQIS